MLSLSHSPSVGPSDTDREDDSPPPAPDVTADPRAPKSQQPLSSSAAATATATSVLFNGPPLTSFRNNEVRQVLLYGVAIVALVIDGYERLCLAQIYSTLLKRFSYNEIHNRRVALGITCVQCTPVQLELLRRAGAMPVSSRRCGLITKREAERLCKSFLADARPPKLPDNFAFEVAHNCAWGCRGSFVPSRYNSSRAKCIKCAHCALFFSPNKFIFHSHRLPDSRYVQPDAANFNSWRRHIRLAGVPPDEVVYAWEDVKAMFNGGSRKRIISCAGMSSRSSDPKRPRNTNNSSSNNSSSTGGGPGAPTEPLACPPKVPYFPVVPLPNKGGFPLGPPFKPLDIRQSFAEYVWGAKQAAPFPMPYGGVLWPPRPPMALEMREAPRSVESSLPPYGMADTTTLADSGRPLSSASEGTSVSFPDRESPGCQSPVMQTQKHASAFRPVAPHRTSPHRMDPDADTTTTACGRSCSDDEVDVTDVSDGEPDTSGEGAGKEEKLDVADSPDSKNEELKEALLQEAEARRRAEREYQAIRDTFEEQVRKEIAYREEVAKQLQIVRGKYQVKHTTPCSTSPARCWLRDTAPSADASHHLHPNDAASATTRHLLNLSTLDYHRHHHHA